MNLTTLLPRPWLFLIHVELSRNYGSVLPFAQPVIKLLEVHAGVCCREDVDGKQERNKPETKLMQLQRAIGWDFAPVA